MLDIWLEKTGFDLGTAQERTVVNLPLPTVGRIDGVVFSLISGKLPEGLRLEGNRIVGTAFEVPRPTKSEFVIRASKDGEISDRTFTMYVEGYDDPQWITPSGNLKVNPNNRSLFVIDGTYVDFYLTAIDDDIRAGEELEYFIGEDDGELPWGLTLEPDGRIHGYVSPILALDITAGEGFYDAKLFDSIVYDPGLRPNTGWDTYMYDLPEYDYFDTVRTPRKLNRTFEFRVSVSDRETVVKREFKIYVVGDDFLRSDNQIMQVGTNLFTADNTYFRSVIWMTARNLGIKRANNYVTIFLDTFDPNPNQGIVVYQLAKQNDDLSPSVLPPGMFLDTLNGELFGYVPYMPAVTKEYKFTVSAIKHDRDAVTLKELVVTLFDDISTGQKEILIYPMLTQEDVNALVYSNIKLGPFNYMVMSYSPPNAQRAYATITLDRGSLLPISSKLADGRSVTIVKTYADSSRSFNTHYATKTFVLNVQGEVDSVIKYVTEPNLGSLRANLPSTLSIVAETTVPEAVMSYKILGGRLPPGLELTTSGEIIGKVRQFDDVGLPGLTVFDTDSTMFDGKTTTFDRSYSFTVIAADQYRFSAITDTFTISVTDPDKRLYSNIFVRPFQKPQKRELFYNFITNQAIFEPSKLYRPADPQFGVQKELKMLIYAGIETSKIADYMVILKTNAKRRRFTLSNPKVAKARKPGSNETLYEVVYLEVIDNYVNDRGESVSNKIKLPRYIKSPVTINQIPMEIEPGCPIVSAHIGKFGNNSIQFKPNTSASLKITSDLIDFYGRGDYTYEGWFFFEDVTKTQALFDLRAYDRNSDSMTIYLKDRKLQLYQDKFIEFGGNWENRTWYHIAVTRSGTEYKAYKNGQLIKEIEGFGGRLSCLRFNIGLGGDNINYGFEGYADEIRVSKTLRYTDNFTPSEQPFVSDNNTLLLIHADGNEGSTLFFDDIGETNRKQRVVRTSGAVGNSSLLPQTWQMETDRYQPDGTPLTVDLTSVNISGSDLETVYPASIDNMRTIIKYMLGGDEEVRQRLDSESEFLPLWMVTSQDSRSAAPGFVKAVPLCYCRPGEGAYILANIKNSGFDFNNIDYEIDRYIIDSTLGNSNDQFLKFSDYRYNV